MSDEHSFDGISGLKQSETDIRHIFNRYVKDLFHTKWKISDEMTEWSKKLINQIQEYVTQQKDLLEQEYARKVLNLNTTRDRVLEQISKYEEKNDTEQINKLISQCNTLKIELALLMYLDRPIPSIQLITDEQLIQQNECHVHRTEDEQSPEELIENHDHDTTSESLSSKPPPIDPPQKSTTDEDRSINSRDKLENNISRRDDLADKCPICYMIFSQNMTVPNRNLHVNEHYKDN